MLPIAPPHTRLDRILDRRTRDELDAAGIDDPRLRTAYAWSRQVNARHGRTYFLATRLLTPAQRPAVHALYGFARFADDLVDDLGTGDNRDTADNTSAADDAGRRRKLDVLEEALLRGLGGEACDHPALTAVVDTAHRYGLTTDLFTDFMTSMRMDTTVTEYADFDALAGYMRGSAEAIGLQMLPVLGTRGPAAEAAPFAARLGTAFQLTNFLRDVGEDLDRGRLYLPTGELAAFGVDRDLLVHCHRTGTTDQRVRQALAHLVAYNREVYRQAEPGLGLLAPVSQPCVRTAFTLYRGILDEIERARFDVFRRRAVVPLSRRLAVALPALARAWAARRRPDGAGQATPSGRKTPPGQKPPSGQKPMACARRFTSLPRSLRSASIGEPGSEASSANSQRRISSSL